MAEPKASSDKRIGEPVICVSANNQSNFEKHIDLSFVILNVNKIGNSVQLTSPTLFIQSLPFHVVVEHEKKKSSGKKGIKIDNFNIHMIVGKDIQSPWSSEFSLILHSRQVLALEKFAKLELTDTNHTISHTIEWERVSELKNLCFEMHIDAERPNGDYQWPSYAATGYNGIVNEGATCYINCLLQSLHFTNQFRRLVYDIPIEVADANDSFLFWLKYIFFALQFNGLPKITTKKMIKCFNWNGMNETNHQDVQEFLRLLMDKIEQFVDGTELKQRLTGLFVGTMKTSITCKRVDYETSKCEAFWDVQLPIEENQNIYGAFADYLDSVTINDFKYDEQTGEKDEALQEFEIIKWPPVLHIHLKRFGYDMKTNTSTKNNNRFDFFPLLDLSYYSADAVYTLHSVLVHSGSLHSGHYIAYICPKADNEWFKFNDEVVTKCPASDAIEENFGDGCRSTNAYMLVYIKTSCVPEILRDVTEADVGNKELIECEITKEIEELANQHRFYEVIVFTSNALQNDKNLKKSKYLFDPNCGHSFFIEKEKDSNDLYKLLLEGFSAKSLVLWLLNIKKESIRTCDMQSFRDKPLKKLCNKDQVHLYVEPLSFSSEPFEKSKQALIFIKEYAAVSTRLIFHTHRYFMLKETVADLQAFIKNALGYDGSTANIAIIVEKGSDEQYSCRKCDPKQTISEIATKFQDTHSAMVVFEIIDIGGRSMYIQFTGAKNSSKGGHPSAELKRIENGIDVIVESDVGEGYVDRQFSPSDLLLDIVESLCAVQGCTTEAIQLLDTEKNVIDSQLLHCSLETYLDDRNKNFRTRGQKQKNLLFTFKMIQSEGIGQPMEITDEDWNETNSEHSVPVKCRSPHSNSMDLDANGIISMHTVKEMPGVVEMMNADEPSMYKIPVRFVEADSKSEYMVKEYDKGVTMDNIVEEFVRLHELNINKLVFTDQEAEFLAVDHRALELYVGCDQTEMVIYFKVEEIKSKTNKRATLRNQSKPTNQRQKRRVYLTFIDQTANRDQMDMDFEENDKFSLAIERIAEVMDLDRSKSHFIDSNGIEVTRFKGTVLQYLESHSANVEYKMIDRSTFLVQEVNSKGIAVGVHSIPIQKSTTIGLICDEFESKHAQVVKMNDGIIQGVVPRDTKAAKLVDDGYAYRIDVYRTSLYLPIGDDTFHVCVKFIGNSPTERLQTPLLVKVKSGQTLNVIGLQIFSILGMANMNDIKNFQYSIDEKFAKKEHVLDKPKDPESIPLVLLNMNQNKTRKPIYSYKDILSK